MYDEPFQVPTPDEVLFEERWEDGDSVLGRNARMLIGATTLSVERVVDAIHGFGGIAVASHIDRESFSILGQLGFVPEGLKLDALELSPRADRREPWLSQARGLPLVTFSDAHRLGEVGTASTSFVVESGCVEELRKALNLQDGRRTVE